MLYTPVSPSVPEMETIYATEGYPFRGCTSGAVYVLLFLLLVLCLPLPLSYSCCFRLDDDSCVGDDEGIVMVMTQGSCSSGDGHRLQRGGFQRL